MNDVNYLAQIVAFNRWKEVNPLPASAIVLWYELMAVCNKAGWPEEFTVPNAVLQSSAGLSRKQFDDARKTLIDFKLIIYKKSKRINQAGKYSINYFPIVQKGQQEGQQEGHQKEHGRGNRRGTLYKYKLNETEINNIIPDASDKERKCLSILANVKNYPFDYEKDLDFIRLLSVDFPDLDMQEQLRSWATYKLDNPLAAKSNPRSQIRTWLKNAVKWGKNKPKQKASSGYWHQW